MNTAWSIDWLSATFKTGVTDLDIRRATCFGFPLKTWTQQVARFGYAQAWAHAFGHTVMANYGRPEMGVHLSFGGRSLRSLSEGGVPATDLLAWTLREGAKITRLDLAIDVFDEPIDVIALAECPRVENAPGTARKWSSIKGNDGGSTAYIGSRSSGKFLRIYDKAAEQGRTDRAWTRFELELKGDDARPAALMMNSLTDLERGEYIRGLIKGVFNPSDDTFQAIMNADPVALKTVKDTDDNNFDWLMNTVAKSMAKAMMRRSDLDVWGAFVANVHANIVALGGSFDESDLKV